MRRARRNLYALKRERREKREYTVGSRPFPNLQKSVNLQYNYYTLGRLDDGTNESLTKRLMFQVSFFFMISCKILCKNPFNLFSYFFL